MKINLDNQDLMNAIREAVERRFTSLPVDQEMVITIKAKRNPSGHEADIEFIDPSDQVDTEADPPFAADGNTGTDENQPALNLDDDD